MLHSQIRQLQGSWGQGAGITSTLGSNLAGRQGACVLACMRECNCPLELAAEQGVEQGRTEGMGVSWFLRKGNGAWRGWYFSGVEESSMQRGRMCTHVRAGVHGGALQR